MKGEIDQFIQTFSWHRNLTKKLLEEIPFEYFTEQLAPRSLTLSCQFIDIGDMQLRMIEMLGGKKPTAIKRPIDNKASKEEIAKYMDECNAFFEREIRTISSEARMDWFGRMNFGFSETLAFLLAHEAMHHGEILSFIFGKNIPMPRSFKTTWGFERNLS